MEVNEMEFPALDIVEVLVVVVEVARMEVIVILEVIAMVGDITVEEVITVKVIPKDVIKVVAVAVEIFVVEGAATDVVEVCMPL